MTKTLLFQKLLYIIILCSLFAPLVSAFDDDNVIDENALVNEGEENEAGGDTDFDVKINSNEEIKIKSNEEIKMNLDDMKMPHIDEVEERVVVKIDIPKIIHQYVRSKDSISVHTQNNINSWKSLNTDWEHKLYDYTDIEKFMQTYHSKTIDLWNALTFEEKIHMWKYAVLETFGGVYADANCFCNKPINQWLKAYDKANILIGIDHIIIPDKVLTEKKLTDSIQFNIHTIVSAPGHEILSNMPFYIHRYRVLDTLNTYELDPDYSKYGRAFFSVGSALWTESVFNYLIENNVVLKDIEHGGLVKDAAILDKNAFSYEATNLSDLPEETFSVYFPEKSKLKEKNEYII